MKFIKMPYDYTLVSLLKVRRITLENRIVDDEESSTLHIIYENGEVFIIHFYTLQDGRNFFGTIENGLTTGHCAYGSKSE